MLGHGTYCVNTVNVVLMLNNTSFFFFCGTPKSPRRVKIQPSPFGQGQKHPPLPPTRREPYAQLPPGLWNRGFSSPPGEICGRLLSEPEWNGEPITAVPALDRPCYHGGPTAVWPTGDGTLTSSRPPSNTSTKGQEGFPSLNAMTCTFPCLAVPRSMRAYRIAAH